MITPLASDHAGCAVALADQLHAAGAVRSYEVYGAFRTVPRHLTVARFYRPAGNPVDVDMAEPGPRVTELIYADRSLVTHHPDVDGADSRASRPTDIAHLLEAAALPGARRVLHIGAGVGYTAALAAHVAQQATVVAVESANAVARAGADAIDRLGLGDRVHYYHGEGYGGCAPEARYDRIIVSTGVTGLSPMWLDQLADDGFIVAPVYTGGLFPLLTIRRGEVPGELVGYPAAAHAEFEPASGLLWDALAISTPPPLTPLPPAEHTGHVPALGGVTEDGYRALWLYLAAADRRITAARTIGLDAEERDRAVLIGSSGAAAIAPDVIASLGPDGPALARQARGMVDRWVAAGRPGLDAWAVRLRSQPGGDAALYTPYQWALTDRVAPVGRAS